MRRKPPSSRESLSDLGCLYATPSDEDCDWHSESPPRKSLSPASKQREHDEFEAEIDALGSHNSDPGASEIFNPIGKTPEEIAVWCAEYERGNRRMMTECRRAVYIMLHSCILHALM